MIRNLIFDLGNVLISFVPSEYLKKKNYPENIRNTILHDIFHSDEWRKLDDGEITTSEAIDSIALKSSLKREEIALIFNSCTDIMFPLDNNVRLLPALKKQGFWVYYLSNFPLDTFEIVKNDYFFFRYFDGGIISSEAKLSKPDVRFYSYFLDTFSLKPEECFFIDDVEENVQVARSLGMKGLVTFGSDNISSILERELAQYQ